MKIYQWVKSGLIFAALMSVYFLQQSQRSPLQVNHSETRDHTNPKRQTVEPVLSEARTDVT